MTRLSNQQPLASLHKNGLSIRFENKTVKGEFVIRIALGGEALWNLALFHCTLNADELQALAQGAMNARAILLADKELRAAVASSEATNYGGSA